MRPRPVVIAAATLFIGVGTALASSPSSPLPAAPFTALGLDTVAPALVTPRMSASIALAARVARIETALSVLQPQVAAQSSPDALRFAFDAYYNYRAQHPEKVHNPYLYFVDYGLDNRTPRGYVFDMDALRVVEGPFTVAHGSGSSDSRNGIPTHFSNKVGSGATSLGLYLTQETYDFTGTSDGSHYSSIGLRLKGVSGRFNSAARERGVVVHGAPYVTDHDAGRSEGCPAMSKDRAEWLIPQIANGGLVFLFSPHDTAWTQHDPWAHDPFTPRLVE